MPAASFQGQSLKRNVGRRRGGLGLWLLPIILIVICIAIITLFVRLDGGGAFATIRDGVQAVTKPIESVCSAVSPLRNMTSDANNSELKELQDENEQLKVLVAELEEYRQQDQRLTALLSLSDTYQIATTSASVTATTSGWNRTATIDKGTNDAIKVGMGVMSSYGLFGQVDSVTASTSTVRLITDASSAVSAKIQGSSAKGILRGSYDGQLIMEYVSIEATVGEGDYILTSGEGGTYPKGIVIGTVKSIETDSSKLYYRINVEPIGSIDTCQEVLVMTGDESEVANLLDEELLDAIQTSSVTKETDKDSSDLGSAGTSTSTSASASSDSSSASISSSTDENEEES